MKQFLIIFLLFFFYSPCFAQVWTNNGAVINILPGTEVKVDNLENINGTITNAGNITLKYNYTNLATVSGNGNYNIGGDWNNTGTFTPGTGTVTFNGTAAQNIFSASTFNNSTINKSSGSVILSWDITINGVLNFVSGKVQTGSNRVIISSTGSVTGSSQSNGWVHGNLQKNIQTGNTSLTYEVGDNTRYTPSAIAFNGVTTVGTLTATVTATDHANLNTSSLNANKSVNRFFSYTNNGIVFSDAAITLNWSAADVDAGANTANFKVGKYNGSSWSYPAVSSPGPTSIQVTGITSFSDFAIGEMLSALPVKLSNLRGYTKNQGIQVEWNTQSEINMDRYEVERSVNGQQFIKTGSVPAKGSGSMVTTYGWFDANPFTTVNYYRIRSVEKTGLVSYSPVVKVNMSTGRSEIIFYPNPFIGNAINLQLNNIPKGYYSISLTNTLGQQVLKKSLLHNGGSVMQTIPVNNLPNGNYLLHITGSGFNFTKQVLKD